MRRIKPMDRFRNTPGRRTTDKVKPKTLRRQTNPISSASRRAHNNHLK